MYISDFYIFVKHENHMHHSSECIRKSSDVCTTVQSIQDNTVKFCIIVMMNLLRTFMYTR